jgi:hypothetical protein
MANSFDLNALRQAILSQKLQDLLRPLAMIAPIEFIPCQMIRRSRRVEVSVVSEPDACTRFAGLGPESSP